MKPAYTLKVAEIEPDQERLADYVLFRDESPYPAVAAGVPVVSHDEVMARRDFAGYTRTIVDALVAPRVLQDLGDVGRRILVQKDFMGGTAELLLVLAGIIQPVRMEIV